MSYDINNIFARILRGEIPCKPVYNDDSVLAFHDIAPKAPIHILVIPKGAYRNFHDFHTNAAAEEVAHFYKVTADLVKEQNLEMEGYRVITNCGANGGQEVPHYHIHLLGGRNLGAMVQSI